jgi:arsenite-transporting ATPase
LSDPDICSIRLVMNPERMVIKEAKRAYSYLQLYGYNVDSVIVNRIIPEMEANGVFAKYLSSQKKYMQEIEESFAPLPVMKVAHLGEEVFGEELLKGIARSMYGDEDPTQIFHNEKPMEIKESKVGYDIRIKVPFIKQEDFELRKYGDELVIELGNRRRNLFLPKFANFLVMDSYRYEEPWLIVKFRKEK